MSPVTKEVSAQLDKHNLSHSSAHRLANVKIIEVCCVELLLKSEHIVKAYQESENGYNNSQQMALECLNTVLLKTAISELMVYKEAWLAWLLAHMKKTPIREYMQFEHPTLAVFTLWG